MAKIADAAALASARWEALIVIGSGGDENLRRAKGSEAI